MGEKKIPLKIFGREDTGIEYHVTFRESALRQSRRTGIQIHIPIAERGAGGNVRVPVQKNIPGEQGRQMFEMKEVSVRREHTHAVKG